MKVTAKCKRSGDWWAVTVPEIEGGFTQARRLDQVPAMVADLVELATGTPADQVRIDVRAETDDLRGVELWKDATASHALARDFQEQAAMYSRAAVADLRRRGLPVRDVATLLGISPQRVSQLAAGPLPPDERLAHPIHIEVHEGVVTVVVDEREDASASASRLSAWSANSRG